MEVQYKNTVGVWLPVRVVRGLF